MWQQLIVMKVCAGGGWCHNFMLEIWYIESRWTPHMPKGGGHTGIENIHATPLWVTDKVVLLGTFFFFFLQMFSRTVNTTSSHPRTEQRVCVRLSVLIGRLPPPPSGDPSLIKTLRHGGCRDTCERDSHILLVGRPPVFVFSLFFLFFYKHLEELWCRSAPVRLWVASIKQCALI